MYLKLLFVSCLVLFVSGCGEKKVAAPQPQAQVEAMKKKPPSAPRTIPKTPLSEIDY